LKQLDGNKMNYNSDQKLTLMTALDIKKSYLIDNKNRLQVLKGISLEIYEGEILEIIGASGAGKSTLLHILGTIDKPDEGKIYFQSRDLLLMKDEELSKFRNKNIGFVFQFHHLLPEFTTLENVIIPMMIGGKDFDECKPRAIELLEYVGLGERLNHKPSELSGGELQRVAIARALVNSPKIIFADEQTGNIDTQNSQNIIQLIQNLNQEFGQTFVIVTHNPDLVNIAHRVMEIKDGLLTSR